MATIMKNRKKRELFDDSFFTLYLVDGVVTLLFLVLDISFMRLTSYVRPVCEFWLPLLVTPAYYLTPYFTLYYYTQFCKILSTLMMNINRFTSVNYPFLHKTVWMEHIRKAIFIIFLLPLIFVWPMAIARTNFFPYHGQGMVLYEHKFEWARTTFGRIALGVPTLLFTIFSSVVTSSKLTKLGKHMRKVDASMTIATIFVSVGFALMLALQVSYLVFNTKTMISAPWIAMIILALTQLCNDFYMLSGPVVLLIIDKRIRNSIFCCCKPRKDFKKTTTEVSMKRATKTNSEPR
ncbi:unnamed protein product [Caenorhabditis sp. 36 PRJEB53466]|nr:unnamed protein product [Caenorhabditis sp. 36 PRJEB53466]